MPLSGYKWTIIKTLISRTKVIYFTQTIFVNKFKNIKQILINNEFSNKIVETEIKYFINKTEQYNTDNTLNYKQPRNL